MKELESDDPMELMCEQVPGETQFLMRCVVEEFAQIGYGAEDLFSLFREPVYPMLNRILQSEGEPFVRNFIEEVLNECGTLRTTTKAVSCSGDI
jgi:hypothetical protein